MFISILDILSHLPATFTGWEIVTLLQDHQCGVKQMCILTE